MDTIRPVAGLTREDFELYVDGQPVEISTWTTRTSTLLTGPGC